MMQALTDQTFKTTLEASKALVLVDFWAPWCQPCQVLMPVVEQALKEQTLKGVDQVKGYSLNIDENPETPSRLHVMSLPTLILFYNNAPLSTLVGAGHQVEDLTRWFEQSSEEAKKI